MNIYKAAWQNSCMEPLKNAVCSSPVSQHATARYCNETQMLRVSLNWDLCYIRLCAKIGRILRRLRF